MKRSIDKREIWIDYIPMLLTAVLIVYFAIIREQSFIKTLPTLITLVVQLLLVHANRFAFLLGGTNALLYGISYYSEGLYFSLISALLISAPLQFFSYFNWKKHTNKSGSELKRLRLPQLAVILVLILASWLGCSIGLADLFQNGSYPLLDALSFVLGTVVTILAAFRFIESQYLNILGCSISLILWILLTIRSPENFNYTIISAYNLFRIIEASIRWTLQYRRQNRMKASLS